MLGILKKEKPEKVALNLQNKENQRVAIKASLDYKIPLQYKGDGLFFMDTKRVKDDAVRGFLRQLNDSSVGRIAGAMFKDQKCDYLVIYDKN